MTIHQSSIDKFRYLECELRTRFPQSLAEAERLRGQVRPASELDVSEAWLLLSDKPLYANTRVGSGARWSANLRNYDADIWRTFGEDGFAVRKVGKGVIAESFELIGRASDLHVVTGIPRHRLFAIQGAAESLRGWIKQEGKYPLAWLADATPLERLLLLRRQLGFGWGTITILHFLTDLGLAVKPDIHLVRTAQQIGLIEPIRGKNPSDLEAIYIVEKVTALAEVVFGPDAWQAIRYTDKILMEASWNELFVPAEV